MESNCSGNNIDDRCTNHDGQQKSIFQKMIAFFTLTKIYIHPDVKLTQGGESFDFLLYKDSEGQSHMEMNVPVKGVLVNFTSTKDRTEFKVLLDAETGNNENTENRIFNSKSDLQHVQPSINKDDSNFQNSAPWLDNAFSDTENGNSNEDHLDENKTLYHRGFPVELVSYSTRKFHLNDKSSFLESVAFRKENISRQRETLILFRLKGMLYSPSALMHLDMEDIEVTKSIDVLCISETESELRVEVLTGLNRYTAFEFAKLLKFLHNGQRVRKLKDLIPCLKLGGPTKDDQAFLERVKTENEGYVKTCYSLNQDVYGNQSQTSKIKDNEDTIAENIKRLQQEMNKIQQDINFNMGATKDNIVGKNYNAKCFTDSKWTDRTQMGNNKERTLSDRPTWKVCLQNREDETNRVVIECLGDPMISQAMYEFFGQYIDCGYKGSIERPPIPWPSMHPLLPYNCRYLDNRGS
ncbi:unnamed protein product [Mytilus coruscus]|uniref:Uncharacterized protein n=1 Tax=Mytilus coruscus TaxID=42192 RepID=A0A6J8EN24_MYTCO|nr:unnamed protein product [Mytilus coruscus]